MPPPPSSRLRRYPAPRLDWSSSRRSEDTTSSCTALGESMGRRARLLERGVARRGVRGQWSATAASCFVHRRSFDDDSLLKRWSFIIPRRIGVVYRFLPSL